MKKSKKNKMEETPIDMELTFSNSTEKLQSMKDNEIFFRDLAKLLQKFHKTVDSHGKKHGVQLDSSVVFKMDNEIQQEQKQPEEQMSSGVSEQTDQI
jgi:hypothetical protein